MPALIVPLIEPCRIVPARGAADRPRSRHQNHRRRGIDPDRSSRPASKPSRGKHFTADATRLLALAAERRAVGFVLGLPINMDGSEGPRAQSTRAFARNLAQLTDLPIALWDERLSTAAVDAT